MTSIISSLVLRGTSTYSRFLPIRKGAQFSTLAKGCCVTLYGAQRRCFFDRAAFRGPSDKARLIFLAGGVFILTYGGGYMYDNWKEEKARSESIKSQLLWDSEQRKFKPSEYSQMKSSEQVPLDKIRAIPISRHVEGPTKLPGNVKLTLFQYQTCPFCCKVRAFLNYYGIPYDVVEVNPVLRQQLKFSTGYRKVPILILSEAIEPNQHGSIDQNEATKNTEKKEVVSVIDSPMQLTDSTLIVSMLATYLLCNPNQEDTLNTISDLYQSMSFMSLDDKNHNVTEIVNKYFLMKGDNIADYKPEVKKLSEERKWREWADCVLVHTISPNIYRSWNESVDSFQYFSIVGDWEKLFPNWERLLVIYAGAAAMYVIGKRLKKRHLLKGDVRESLYDACRQWSKAVGNQRTFMGGNSPNLADLAVYGVLNSCEGCIAFQDALEHTNIGAWYFAVKEVIKTQAGHRELTL